MKLTIKQARQIKNIIAIELLEVDRMTNGLTAEKITKDPEAWKHCDINQRFSLDKIVSDIRKI